jgi:hypothetical protein
LQKVDSLEDLGLDGRVWNRIQWLGMVRWRNVVKTVMNLYVPYTVEPRFTNAPVNEQFGSRTNFTRKTSRMTNGVSDYEHASWQQRQAESIGAGVSVATIVN